MEVKTVTTQISAIELNPELVNIAYEMGLNVTKTCENALKEAIRRLKGSDLDFEGVRNAEVAGSISSANLLTQQKTIEPFLS
jgi:hypothetical protein